MNEVFILQKTFEEYIMKILILLAFFAILTNAANHDRFKRFIGGKEARIAQFPYLATLRFTDDKGHFCGGSIISDQHVLTAAHCTYEQTPESYFISAGSINSSEVPKEYLVEEHIIHPQYDNESDIHDISIIKIKTKFEFSKYVQKIPLTKVLEFPQGTIMTVCGFGRKKYDGGRSELLQYSNVTVINNKRCKLNMFWLIFDKHEVTKYHICTQDKNIGFCKGDSGGPLTYKGEQVGIVSWMVGKCAENYPDVYTKVAPYLDWINDYVGLEDKIESVKNSTKKACKRKFFKMPFCFI